MAGEAIHMNEAPRAYPRTVNCDGSMVEISLLTPADGADLRAFIATLSPHDLLFLSRDITHPKVIEAWLDAIPEGRIRSLIARENGEVVGCTAIVRHELSWSSHVGELRVLLSPSQRGKGLGRMLIQECFAQALELGLEKLCVQMTLDQRGAIASFEGLGFRAEALLRNHVKDHEGKTHDLAILSHDVGEVQARMAAYGIADALGEA
jgi:N-acetylglutamate synthase-like GNAT family acetyltransferase